MGNPKGKHQFDSKTHRTMTIIIPNDILVLDRRQDADFVHSVLALSGLELADVDFLDSITTKKDTKTRLSHNDYRIT